MSVENTNTTPVNSPEKPKKSPEKSPRITNSQKEKDPKKVAAGKKLGAISRMAKSQKKNKAEAHKISENDETSSTTKISGFYVGLAVCVTVAVVGLGMGWFKNKTPKHNEPPKQNHNPNLISLE